MHSSTSNSSDRAPTGPWAKIWVTAALCCILALVITELTARQFKHQPSVIDDLALWSQVRDELASTSHPAIALLGASRIQLGVSPSLLERRFSDYRVFQLAVEGSSPVATLRDIADDTSFCGTVICELTPKYARIERHEDQANHVRFYHNQWSVDQFLNRRIRTELQSRFVIFNPSVSLVRIAGYLSKQGTFPPPAHVVTKPDRSRVADFSLHHSQRLGSKDPQFTEDQVVRNSTSEPTVDELIQQIAVVRPMIQAIEDRGGHVVFVRMPTDRHGDREASFWRRFEQEIAPNLIDYASVPAMSHLKCPDGDHLDGRDIRPFTIGLADELIKRDVISPDYASQKSTNRIASTQ